MRVFCPEHKKGFFTPRLSPIRCESRGHVLGELDFRGTAQGPAEVRWQYCCNCEHFCPIDFDRDGLERCPVCTRRTSIMYVCDRCFTVSFESNTPLQTKNFTLTTEGAPKPSCPGCLQEASRDLREHFCEELQATFITALTSCPICAERLDIGPSFPSSIAHYLRRIKAANKQTVTFDYDSESFLSVEDGEFVLVSVPPEGAQPFVLPRSPRFTSKRDFYELYQDYYHCTNVDVGEVHVIEPATVEYTGDGWKFISSGILEVVPDVRQVKAAPEIKSQKQPVNDAMRSPSVAPPSAEAAAAPCPGCGVLVETKYAFCWKCGSAMKPDVKSSEKAKQSITPPPVTTEEEQPAEPNELGRIQQTILSSVPSWRRFAAEDDESTIQHRLRDTDRPSPRSSVPDEQRPRRSVTGSVLKLTAMAFGGVLLTTLGFFVLRNSVSQLVFGNETQETTVAAAPSQKTPASAPAGPVKEAPKQTNAPEDELQKLRDQRMRAAASDRTRILRAFAQTEKQYPDDYRFPYERAKFVINRGDNASHEEAFNALSAAAEKAILADKSNEMLVGLEADKTGDFHKLAHGHREWKQVVQALKSKDTTLLSANTH